MICLSIALTPTSRGLQEQASRRSSGGVSERVTWRQQVTLGRPTSKHIDKHKSGSHLASNNLNIVGKLAPRTIWAYSPLRHGLRSSSWHNLTAP